MGGGVRADPPTPPGVGNSTPKLLEGFCLMPKKPDLPFGVFFGAIRERREQWSGGGVRPGRWRTELRGGGGVQGSGGRSRGGSELRRVGRVRAELRRTGQGGRGGGCAAAAAGSAADGRRGGVETAAGAGAVPELMRVACGRAAGRRGNSGGGRGGAGADAGGVRPGGGGVKIW
nr:rRNA 2'-O-methyltransferase fibrillarin-like [Aegilops tauschii subsp. strangulata]